MSKLSCVLRSWLGYSCLWLFCVLLNVFPLASQAAVSVSPNLQLSLVDGTANNLALANTSVHAREVMADGSSVWRAVVKTDAAGKASLALEGLGAGRSYQLYAISPFDNNYRASTVIKTSGSFLFRVGSPILKVTVKDALARTALINLPITAWYKQAGKLVWVAQKNTDASGKVAFDIPQLSQGLPVQLSATAFNATRAMSDPITKVGETEFTLGETRIQLLDASQAHNPALAATTIHVRELLADGSSIWVNQGTTDAQGVLRLNLEAGKKYVLLAQDKVFNKYRTSAPLQKGEQFTFKLGSPALKVKLSDALSNANLAGVNVTAYQLLDTGAYQWRTAALTNSNGEVALDLPELSTGGKIELRAAAYNQFTARSRIISQAGSEVWKLGTSRIKVVDGTSANQAVLANHTVYVREKFVNGTEQWFATTKTDSAGLLRLDLPGLEQGRQFYLQALSPLTNTYKASAILKTAGDSVFVVGSNPLVATLKDAYSKQALVGAEVVAWRILADGTRQWRGQQKTDAAGKVIFDLAELNTESATIRLQTTVYNQFTASSPAYTRSGAVDFLLGSVVVTVRDGTAAGQALLPNLEVHVREQLVDGKSVWLGRGITDSNGSLRLDLPDLDKGKQYILNAISPVTKQYRDSQLIKVTGQHTFLVGTRLLQVSMLNAVSGLPVPSVNVTAYKLDADGVNRWKGWTTSANTDAQGIAKLDAAAFSVAGNRFILVATPYNGGRVDSPSFAAGEFVLKFPVCSIPVTLTNRATNTVMPEVALNAFRLDSTNRLFWVKSGKTDAAGKVQFDLETLASGERHVLVAQDPFKQGRNYYSRIVTVAGAVDFGIRLDAEGSRLDWESPRVEVLSPKQTEVGTTGFIMAGTALDNWGVRELAASLTSNATTQALPIEFNPLTGDWSAKIASGLLSAGSHAQITIIAWDKAGNKAERIMLFNVIADQALPVIQVSSHREGDEVVKTGFILKGRVSDDTGLASLTAQAQGAGNLAAKALTISSQGDWAWVVPNGQLTEGQSLKLTLTVTDLSGKVSTQILNLQVIGAAAETRQLINRITFGASPSALAEVRRVGADAFLESQLKPNQIQAPAFDSAVADLDLFTHEDLQAYTLFHMVNSPRQLQEVMTWFWDNHFNTNLDKTGNKLLYELAENDVFRANALGNFYNLLLSSAQSPAMLIYLDNLANVKANANENYAREVLELHTVGVKGGYAQREVEVLAEIFTGWQVQNDRFYFNAAQHNAVDKVFWGQSIKGGGVEEGENALRFLARHPATAKFICSKLITVFVSDQPVEALLQRCSDTFISTASQPDQIAQVLRTILTAPEFHAEANFNSKFRTPVEFGVAAVRAFAGQVSTTGLVDETRRMGLSLHRNAIPTGWSETGDDWISTGLLQERLRFVNRLVAGSVTGIQLDPAAFFRSRGALTSESILAESFDLLMNNHYSAVEWQTAFDILNAEGSFDLEAANANTRLKAMLATLLSYPACNYQ